MMQYMQLLPCAKYTQSTFVDSLRVKDKRKAADEDEALSQSPTKKGLFTATDEQDSDVGLDMEE